MHLYKDTPIVYIHRTTQIIYIYIIVQSGNYSACADINLLLKFEMSSVFEPWIFMHAIPLCKCTMIHSTTVLHLPVFVVSNLLLLNIELRWLNTILWCSLSWQVGQDTSSYAGWRPTSTSSHARSQPQSRTRACRLAPKIPCRPVTLFRPPPPPCGYLALDFLRSLWGVIRQGLVISYLLHLL